MKTIRQVDREWAYCWGGRYHTLGVNIPALGVKNPPRLIRVTDGDDPRTYTRMTVRFAGAARDGKPVLHVAAVYYQLGCDVDRVMQSMLKVTAESATMAAFDAIDNPLRLSMQLYIEFIAVEESICMAFSKYHKPGHAREEALLSRDSEIVDAHLDLLEKIGFDANNTCTSDEVDVEIIESA